jgi:hypothetical protein
VIISASFQLATIAIVKANMIVDIVWILNNKVSPTSRLTIRASVDSLAPIDPLKQNSILLY